MPETESGLYEGYYRRDDPRFRRWRELGARRKASNVIALAGELEIGTVAEIGCGDGALLAELSERGFGTELHGFEIADSAVARVRDRRIPRLASVERFDGERLAVTDRAYDLAILSHVLEHAENPAGLLAEAGRVAHRVVFEVPLEATLTSHREAYRRAAREIGHLHRFSRRSARRLAATAGLAIERDRRCRRDAETRLFWADTGSALLRARLTATASGALAVIPPLSRLLLVEDYACLCRGRPPT